MKEITIRASSLPTMFDCPARWHAEHVERLRTTTGGPAHLGTSLHHASAKFDQARVEGGEITTDDAVDLFVDRLNDPREEDGEIAWDSSLKKQTAVDVGVSLTIDYCERISNKYTFDAVEIRCTPMTIKVGDVLITLTGTADRVRKETVANDVPWWEDEPAVVRRGIADVKSGKRVIDSEGRIAIDKHIAQLGSYELIELLAGKDTGYQFTLPAEVIAFPTSGAHRKIATTEVHSPSRILLGDETQPEGLLHAAAKMASAELFPGNPRSMLCSDKYCPKYAKCWWRGHIDK